LIGAIPFFVVILGTIAWIIDSTRSPVIYLERAGACLRVTRKTTSKELIQVLGQPSACWGDGTESGLEYTQGDRTLRFCCDDRLGSSGRL